jgi:hypothetical protein
MIINILKIIKNKKMTLDQKTSPTVIINYDIYAKYNVGSVEPTTANITPNNQLNNSVVYPSMFDRWTDI